MRILAVDPGQSHIGIAISDPGGKVAFPLTVLPHQSKLKDAQAIIKLAEENQVERIVIGQALSADNLSTLQSRRSVNLAQTIQALCSIPVVLWEEYESTRVVEQLQTRAKTRRKRQNTPSDHLAAVVILQSYILDQETFKHE